jgi:hypothetical protein
MRLHRRLLPIAFVLVAPGGCLTVTSPTSPVDREVVLAPAQSLVIEGAGLAIRFDGVDGDSRCPADALCVLGGDAIVRIVVTDRRTTPYDLHTGDMRPVTHGDFSIALVRLEPYPFSARPIDPAEYRVTLRVTRSRT